MDDEKDRSDHIERIQGFRLIDDAYSKQTSMG